MQPSITLVGSFEEAQAFLEWCRLPHDKVAIDTETTDIGWSARIRTVQFGSRDAAWIIPFERGGWGALVREGLALLTTCTFIMHNFTFDQTVLEEDGIFIPYHRVRDTQIMAHLIEPYNRKGLKAVADRVVGPFASEGQKELDKKMSANKWTWATIPIDTVEYWWYGGLDTILTVLIDDYLEPKVFPAFERIYDLEYACQVVLKGVVNRGVLLDRKYCTAKSESLRQEAALIRLDARDRFDIGNMTSDAEVSKKMLELGWEPDEWTASGRPSMKREILNALVATDEKEPYIELARAVVHTKHLEKMAGTQYLEGFLSMVDPEGFIHPSINPLGARTGRMSVNRPALQTLHRDATVRDAFIPREGNKLIFADYDQMEVRLAAHFAGDQGWMDLIMQSEDVHRSMAALIYGVPEDAVTKKQRQVTKNAVYSKIYGAGPPKFAQTAGIPLDDAWEFLRNFDRAVPGVVALQDYINDVCLERYKSEGMVYLTTPAGRRQLLAPWEVTGTYIDNKGRERLDGEVYKEINYLVQGTGADELKRAVVDADRAGIAGYLVLLVHDEMGFDVPAEEVDEVKHTIREVMENHTEYDVPLTVGMDICERWGDKYSSTRTVAPPPITAEHYNEDGQIVR